MRLITSPMTALAVILTSVVLLAACGGGDESEADAATATATATATAQPTSTKGELIPTATPFASRPTPTIVSESNSGGGTNSDSSGGAPQSTAPTPAATSAPTSTTHVVVEGDTLSAIADQYGVTLDAIMEANDITDASLIFVGQELTIPAAATTDGGSDGSDTGERTHTVVEGDTLTDIADQYGVTIEAIMEANGIEDASLVFVGQVLDIPDAAPAPEPTPTPTPEATAEGGGSAATYTVTDGDTATGIAEAFGVTLQALADANELTIEELNNLQIGQVLNIPAAGQ